MAQPDARERVIAALERAAQNLIVLEAAGLVITQRYRGGSKSVRRRKGKRTASTDTHPAHHLGGTDLPHQNDG